MEKTIEQKLEEARCEIATLTEQLIDERRRNDLYEAANKAAGDYLVLKKGMLDAGMTEQEFIALLPTFVVNSNA